MSSLSTDKRYNLTQMSSGCASLLSDTLKMSLIVVCSKRSIFCTTEELIAYISTSA